MILYCTIQVKNLSLSSEQKKQILARVTNPSWQRVCSGIDLSGLQDIGVLNIPPNAGGLSTLQVIRENDAYRLHANLKLLDGLLLNPEGQYKISKNSLGLELATRAAYSSDSLKLDFTDKRYAIKNVVGNINALSDPDLEDVRAIFGTNF